MLEKETYILQQSLDEELEEEAEEEPEEEPVKTTITYGKDQMDKYLNNTGSVKILKSYKLKLPSNYKDKSLVEFLKAFNKGLEKLVSLKETIKNSTFYDSDTDTGLIKAYAIAGDDAKDKTKKLIDKHNTMEIFVDNMRQLRNYKTLTGTGIIHFNNRLQLIDRLELLAGSIFAGNNGVKNKSLLKSLIFYIN